MATIPIDLDQKQPDIQVWVQAVILCGRIHGSVYALVQDKADILKFVWGLLDSPNARLQKRAQKFLKNGAGKIKHLP